VQGWARNPPRTCGASAWARGAKRGAHSVAFGIEEGRDRVSHACDTRGHVRGGIRGADENTWHWLSSKEAGHVRISTWCRW